MSSSVRYDSTSTSPEPNTIAANLRAMFLKGLSFPAALVVFFLIAPAWLEHRLHEQVDRALVSNGRAGDRAAWQEIDFGDICASAAPEHAELRQRFAESGICRHFHLLTWARRLSLLLMAVWLGSTLATLWLNRRAKRSRDALIAAYRMAWRICLTAAVTQLVLLIPLLGYGIYELTTLAADRYFPAVIVGIVIGGIVAIWRSGQILLKAPPLEFTEPLARVVSAEDAPGLWQAVRDAAQQLGAKPPDQIVIGMQMNFYVTELSVRVDDGIAHGRTLFLSYPLLKLLSPAEVLAIIGHELGHFLGEDTRLTREFYPLRFKVNGTLEALAHAGWAAWTSIHGLGFFNWAFGGTEQAMSRERELIADGVAAKLTSPATMAQALVKFQVMAEALHLHLASPASIENPFSTSLVPLIREQLAPNRQFWRDLFDAKTPHPLDSHPDLRVRLESLRQPMTEEQALAIATAEAGSAYDAWLGGREAVFAGFVAKAHAALGQFQRQRQVATASYDTAEGRTMLEKLFPERRFKMRKSTRVILVGAGALIAGVAALLTTLIEGDAGRIVPVVMVGVGGVLCWRAWRSMAETELILRADRIFCTAWNRPLPWADVSHLSAINVNGGIQLAFHLKQKAPAYARRTLFRFERETVRLSLHYYDAKQQELLELIHKYHTRQMETPAG